MAAVPVLGDSELGQREEKEKTGNACGRADGAGNLELSRASSVIRRPTRHCRHPRSKQRPRPEPHPPQGQEHPGRSPAFAARATSDFSTVQHLRRRCGAGRPSIVAALEEQRVPARMAGKGKLSMRSGRVDSPRVSSAGGPRPPLQIYSRARSQKLLQQLLLHLNEELHKPRSRPGRGRPPAVRGRRPSARSVGAVRTEPPDYRRSSSSWAPNPLAGKTEAGPRPVRVPFDDSVRCSSSSTCRR